MTTNHPSTPASPGLSAINQVVADLYYKYQLEEHKGSELERLLLESRTRRDNLNQTITNLKVEYSLEFTPNVVAVSPASENIDVKMDAIEKAIHYHRQATQIANWLKPDNSSWRELIRDTIKARDELLSISDIADALGMDEEAKAKNLQTLSGVLAAYRGTNHFVGIKTYYKTQKGAAFSQFFTGVPSFFDDVELSRLKPEYDMKLRSKLGERHLFLSEREAAHS